MLTFEQVFGPPPDPSNYRDDALLAQQVRNRYKTLSGDFVGVKAAIDYEDGRSGPINWGVSVAELTPSQLLAGQYMRRAADKLQTAAYLVSFNWTHMPVRILTVDMTTVGGSSNLPFREPRPWLLPVPEADITRGGFDKIILREIAGAIRSGVGFDYDLSILPEELQEQNAENLKRMRPPDAPVQDLPNI